MNPESRPQAKRERGNRSHLPHQESVLLRELQNEIALKASVALHLDALAQLSVLSCLSIKVQGSIINVPTAFSKASYRLQQHLKWFESGRNCLLVFHAGW